MMFGLMWIWRGWLEMLLLLNIIGILLFIFVMAQFVFYNQLFFKRIGINHSKNKSNSTRLWLFKFFYFLEYKGTVYVNDLADRNKKVLGKGYVYLSLFGVFFFIVGVFFFADGLSYKLQLNAIENIQNKEQKMDYVSGIITLFKKQNDKVYKIRISNKKNNKINSNTFYLHNKNITKKMLGLGAEARYYVTKRYFFNERKHLATLSVNNKNILNLRQTHEYLKNHDGTGLYIYVYGIIFMSLHFLMLWIRYHLYGFKGIDKLIEVKQQELQIKNLTTEEK
jgi:hypothetical protein